MGKKKTLERRGERRGKRKKGKRERKGKEKEGGKRKKGKSKKEGKGKRRGKDKEHTCPIPMQDVQWKMPSEILGGGSNLW